MLKLFNLIKINIPDYLGIFAINKKPDNKNKTAAVLKSCLLFLLYLIIGIFIYKLASQVIKGFAAMDLSYLVLSEFFSIGSLFIFFFNIYKSEIYNLKEYEMLITMPIKKETIILSKLIIIYINSLLLAFLFMIPTLITYSHYANLDLNFYILFIAEVLIMPIFPCVIAIFITSLITIISSKFKYQKLVQTFLLFVLTFILTYISFKVTNLNSLDMFNIESSFSKFFNSIYPLNRYFLESIIDNNPLSTLIYYGVSLISIVLVTAFLSFSYSKVINKINNNQIHIYKKSIKFKKHSKAYALLEKDLKKLITTPYYILNSLMPCLVLLVLAITLNFVDIFKIINIPLSNNILTQKLPFLFMFVILLSSTTSVAISLESKNYYILKTAPLSTKLIFLSKIILNQIIIIPICIISLIIFNIAMTIPLVTNIITIVSIFIFSFFIGTYGLFINLLFPLKEWKNESKVLNSSLSPFLTMYSAIIIAILILLNKLNNFTAYILLVNLIIFIITITLYFIMKKYHDKFLLKIL